METTRDAPDRDADLAVDLQRGDPEAVGTLYDRYGRIAFGLAFRIMGDISAAEDIVQEAFVSAWTNARAFDPSRGPLRGWLLTIVRNRAIDRLRSGKRARQDAPLQSAENIAGSADTLGAVTQSADRQQVRNAFASLPDAQRRTLELAYFDGLTHVEIAQRMAVPLGTVKGRMRLGLDKMRAYLQTQGVEI
jgi:RNA polymerase sigma-70 factor (ECF subfamily)